jgi:hypothetical protein
MAFAFDECEQTLQCGQWLTRKVSVVGTVHPKGITATPAAADSEGEDYEVEQIVAKRQSGKKVQYLVKWLGYDASQNTWLDANHLQCPDLIADFEALSE